MVKINPTAPPPPPTALPADEPGAPATGRGTANRPVAAQIEQHQAQSLPEAPQPARKMSQAEAERLYSQAGFSRAGRKRGRGVELDDVTQGPIPLPVDEVDESAWEQSTLDDAQQEMALQGGQMQALQQELAAQTAQNQGQAQPFARLAALTFAPTPEDVQRLEALSERPSPPQPSLEGVHRSMAAHFNLDLHAVAAGPAMVAAALVVGGMADAVQPTGDGLEGSTLARGMQKLIERSNGAVEDARARSSGISRLREQQRTFVHYKKR